MYPCFVILKCLSLKILFLLNDFNSILINYKNTKMKKPQKSFDHKQTNRPEVQDLNKTIGQSGTEFGKNSTTNLISYF